MVLIVGWKFKVLALDENLAFNLSSLQVKLESLKVLFLVLSEEMLFALKPKVKTRPHHRKDGDDVMTVTALGVPRVRKVEYIVAFYIEVLDCLWIVARENTISTRSIFLEVETESFLL